ncbi:glycosyltransferase family 4 protein [Candidatus Peregrinibacteria bacterium]|nr:glycosyltransferase family 4 protein [Candidatus Peregrinibacteria bacterium]
MKIGINARFLSAPFTGIGQYTRSLVAAMAAIEANNQYILFTPELVDVDLPANCKQIRVAEKPYRSDSVRKAHWEHILVPREMERFEVDVAHYPYPSNPRRRLSMPTIVTVHDVIPWRLKAYRQKMRSKVYHLNARLALRKANHILTVSDFSKSEIVKYLKVKAENITVTPLAPPFSPDKVSCPRFGLRRDYFLYVGGYDDRKNVPRLMKAYQKHIAPFYPIDLILVGGKNQDLEVFLTDEYCERVAGTYLMKPKGKVIFTEHLDQSELVCLYQKALALTHMSLYEGFNLALVEAMQAGIPIIASDIPVHHEVTQDGALFVDPHNIDSIGNAMHQLVHDKALQRELVQKTQKRAQDFDWKKTAEETLYVYSLFT